MAAVSKRVGADSGSRNRTMMIVAVVLLVVAGGVYWFMRPQNAEQSYEKQMTEIKQKQQAEGKAPPAAAVGKDEKLEMPGSEGAGETAQAAQSSDESSSDDSSNAPTEKKRQIKVRTGPHLAPPKS